MPDVTLHTIYLANATAIKPLRIQNNVPTLHALCFSSYTTNDLTIRALSPLTNELANKLGISNRVGSSSHRPPSISR
jgi:hypothetical protein